MVFRNRQEAGRLLAEKLSFYFDCKRGIVLAIPRGGVVIGEVLSRELRLPLDVVVTKKIGAPHNSELAIGAVAEDGEPIFDQQLISSLEIDERYLNLAVTQVRKIIQSYIKKFRLGKCLELGGWTVFVTDDGVATGYTMEAALSWLSNQGCADIVLALPIGAQESVTRLRKFVDTTVCLDQPEWFNAVGQFYQEFRQVEDEEVLKILSKNS